MLKKFINVEVSSKYFQMLILYFPFKGEAMEKGLRECCRSIRIGKILIQTAEEDKLKSSVVYAKFPNDITARKILLMYPITSKRSGSVYF